MYIADFTIFWIGSKFGINENHNLYKRKSFWSNPLVAVESSLKVVVYERMKRNKSTNKSNKVISEIYGCC